MSEGFHAEVVVRWSDMDAFQHINHARMVTLLEEARIPWLFEDSRPTVTLRDGAVIADLHVRYRGQLRHEDSPLDVFMWVEKVRAVDFTIAYEVRPRGADLSVPPSIVHRLRSRPSISTLNVCAASAGPSGSTWRAGNVHERVLTVPEEAERKNLAGFIGHALRLDESAVIRMRRRGDAHLSVWASTGFDALATRTVAGTIN